MKSESQADRRGKTILVQGVGPRRPRHRHDDLLPVGHPPGSGGHPVSVPEREDEAGHRNSIRPAVLFGSQTPTKGELKSETFIG